MLAVPMYLLFEIGLYMAKIYLNRHQIYLPETR